MRLPLNDSPGCRTSWTTWSWGRWGVDNAMGFFKPGVLLITPGDREDILLAVATSLPPQETRAWPEWS